MTAPAIAVDGRMHLSLPAVGILLGMALAVAGCSTAPATTPQPSPPPTTAAITKPVVSAGKALADISASDVAIRPGYLEESGAAPEVARDAAQLGLSALKVFTSDYAKYQTQSEALDQEQLLALLPEVQEEFRPLMAGPALANFAETWEKQASDPKDLKNDILMLATKDIDEDLDLNGWENSSGLDCGVSDAQWTVTFDDPEVDYVQLEGHQTKATVFKAKAYYFVPCTNGQVLRQDMDWQLVLGSNPENTEWRIYRWDRTPVGKAAYIQQ